MISSDVVSSSSTPTRGGSHRHSVSRVYETGTVLKEGKGVIMKSNVRARSVAGWSEIRGKGEYLILVNLMLCMMAPVLVDCDMNITKEELEKSLTSCIEKTLSVQIAPIQSDIYALRQQNAKDHRELSFLATNY